MTRAHSPAGHAAAGRWYAKNGARPLTQDTRQPTNDDRLSSYYAKQGAIDRRPRAVLAWDKPNN